MKQRKTLRDLFGEILYLSIRISEECTLYNFLDGLISVMSNDGFRRMRKSARQIKSGNKIKELQAEAEQLRNVLARSLAVTRESKNFSLHQFLSWIQVNFRIRGNKFHRLRKNYLPKEITEEILRKALRKWYPGGNF